MLNEEYSSHAESHSWEVTGRENSEDLEQRMEPSSCDFHITGHTVGRVVSGKGVLWPPPSWTSSFLHSSSSPVCLVRSSSSSNQTLNRSVSWDAFQALLSFYPQTPDDLIQHGFNYPLLADNCLIYLSSPDLSPGSNCLVLSPLGILTYNSSIMCPKWNFWFLSIHTQLATFPTVVNGTILHPVTQSSNLRSLPAPHSHIKSISHTCYLYLSDSSPKHPHPSVVNADMLTIKLLSNHYHLSPWLLQWSMHWLFVCLLFST